MDEDLDQARDCSFLKLMLVSSGGFGTVGIWRDNGHSDRVLSGKFSDLDLPVAWPTSQG
jgi:hypothetical protein